MPPRFTVRHAASSGGCSVDPPSALHLRWRHPRIGVGGDIRRIVLVSAKSRHIRLFRYDDAVRLLGDAGT